MSRLLTLFACFFVGATALAGSGPVWEDTDRQTADRPPLDDPSPQVPPPDDPSLHAAPDAANRPLLESDDTQHGAIYDQRDPYWGVEVRLTPFRPTLSDNDDVLRLYKLVYEHDGTGIIKGKPMMVGLDIDWYPIQTFGLRTPVPGLLGVFLRVAYWNVSGPTRLCSDNGKPADCTAQTVFSSTVGNDSGSLSVIPVGLGVVYRLDSIRKNTGIPLVFNFKGGFDYYIWWAESGAGSANYTDPQTGERSNARGGTLGFNVSAGLSLGLDIFGGKVMSGDRSSTRSALFAEYQLNDGRAIAGKNPGKRLDFTDHTMITIGLELEFL